MLNFQGFAIFIDFVEIMFADAVTPNVHNSTKTFHALHFQGWRLILEKRENVAP